jgi:hypothetical protein
MLPGGMSLRLNVTFSNVTRLNIAYCKMSPVPNVALGAVPSLLTLDAAPSLLARSRKF